MKNRLPPCVFWESLIIIFVFILIIFFFGNADQSTINKILEIGILHDYILDAIYVWSLSLYESIGGNLGYIMLLETWIHFLTLLPLLFSYIYFSARLLKYKHLKLNSKIIFLAPYALFPLFFLGHDYYRWISLLIINMFISFLYLLYENDITIEKLYLLDKILLWFLLLHTLSGPIGVFFDTGSFPFLKIIGLM